VAEGQGRQHRPEFIQHLSIATGRSLNWRRIFRLPAA
jgi:hypothetical protein